MSSNQNQDLVFFQNNSLIAHEILNTPSSSLSIISHQQGTSPTWLINSLIENALIGTAGLINKDLMVKEKNRSQVYMISFLNNDEFYIRNCKKNGLDLNSQSNFHFIDCFSDLFTSKIQSLEHSRDLINKLFLEIKLEISKNIDEKKIIFIEWPELLLLATDVLVNDLVFHLLDINKLCRQLFVISPQDIQVIDTQFNNTYDTEFKITDFLTKLYFRSQLNINLQPLVTGRANDITGSLTVSKGTIPYHNINLKIIEKEYIYHITKESSVKLFLR